ncbi:hypothetical protein H2200_005180 [Cladophialophora chaetospira]|uniref:RTA1 domain protein n=1 Tax=Cladophialophora chaetospira TaxID=386627 RepID=A0AA38XBH4_9EURO|nr:hypothetical protein H2200_005180 [Cladophialophora chaetospira]
MSNSTSNSTTSDEDLNIYFYDPSTPAAVVFSVLYAILTLWHAYINFIFGRSVVHKHKYTIPLFVACVISTAGWVIRIVSVNNTSSIPLYATSASYIVISPIFVCATLYLLVTRLIRTTLPEDDKQQVFLGVRPRWLGRLFITSDISSFLTQGAGSGIASSGNWEGNLKTVGTNVLLVGLSLQLATFTVFLVVLGTFQRRVRRSKDVDMSSNVNRVLKGVWIAGFFVQVRSIYRVVEFAMGVNGYLFKHEWCLYVFEAAPMFIALSVLAWCHPVKWMQDKSAPEFAMQDNVANTKKRSKFRIKGPSKGNAV